MIYNETQEFFESRKCEYTAYEIAQQPLVWKQLSTCLRDVKPAIDSFMDRLGNLADMRIVMTGAGSSGFAGRAVAGFAANAYSINCEAIHTTDIVSAPETYFPSLYRDKPTLLISFARSGNSPESDGTVRYARKRVKNLFEIAIVCDGSSRLAKTTSESGSGLVIVMPEATNDKGFAMTSSVTTMMLAGFAVLCRKDFDKITEEIPLIANQLEKTMTNMAETAKSYADWGFERAWYLGSGPVTALAQEGSLKMMELTNGAVVAGHNNAPEFRHGPKTVLNPKTLTIHFISSNEFTAKYDMDMLDELYSQRDGNKVIAIHNIANPVQVDLAVPYDISGLSVCAEISAGLQGLVFMQLISMYKSLALGIPTDNPSPSGLVNRVVQGVTVYPY